MRDIFFLFLKIFITLVVLYLDRIVGGHVLLIGWWVWLFFREDYSVFLLFFMSLYHDVVWSYPLGTTGILTLILSQSYRILDRRIALPKIALVVFIFIFCVILSMIDGSGMFSQLFFIGTGSLLWTILFSFLEKS